MKKTIFNKLRYIESICSLEILTVLSMFVLVFLFACEYSINTGQKYGAFILNNSNFIIDIVMLVYAIGIVASSLKLIINSVSSFSTLDFLKSFFQPILSIVGVLFMTQSVEKMILIFHLNTDYMIIASKLMYIFWLLLFTIALRRLINSNVGFYTRNEKQELNNIAMRYFDGNLKGFNLEKCDDTAIKYGGRHNG